MCLPDRNQELTLELNGASIATHRWTDCEPWSATVDIPASLVRIGANDLTLRPGYAASPPETSGGAQSDTRRLSVGFTQLRMDAVR